MTSLRTSSIDNHGFSSAGNSHNGSRPVSPIGESNNNPYRNSMAQAIEEAKRLSGQSYEVRTKNESAQVTEHSIAPASIRSFDQDTINKNSFDNDSMRKGSKDVKRPKTTMFAVNEDELEKRDMDVQARMKKDLKIKFRIRIAKCFLRCINFGCSLVVLSLVANSFAIFFATRNLPTRNNLPPWAPGSVLWPAYATLGIACLSLATAVCVLVSYWRGGHRKAEKAAIWFTAMSIAGFFFMIILWAITAGIITNARNNSGGKDLWAWSCKQNNRKELFQSTIDYDLVCRQMDWSFVCSLIEIIVETLSILLYAAAFWRFSQKTKLRKSMNVRDQIREELYLKKLNEGDMTVYRPEFDPTPHHEEGLDLNDVEQGIRSKIPTFGRNKNKNNNTVSEKRTSQQQYYPPVPVPSYSGAQGHSSAYYPPVPVPMYAGAYAQPIINPNTGLPYES